MEINIYYKKYFERYQCLINEIKKIKFYQFKINIIDFNDESELENLPQVGYNICVSTNNMKPKINQGNIFWEISRRCNSQDRRFCTPKCNCITVILMSRFFVYNIEVTRTIFRKTYTYAHIKDLSLMVNNSFQNHEFVPKIMVEIKNLLINSAMIMNFKKISAMEKTIENQEKEIQCLSTTLKHRNIKLYEYKINYVTKLMLDLNFHSYKKEYNLKKRKLQKIKVKIKKILESPDTVDEDRIKFLNSKKNSILIDREEYKNNFNEYERLNLKLAKYKKKLSDEIEAK